MTVTANTIIQLLAQKHKDDLWVPECKDGASQGTSHFRLDGWAMNRSWARPWAHGYEVKVSRSDFLRDEKWPAYLQYCHLFSFVCPHGLIQPEELPSDVGLIWTTKSGTRLVTRRKPVLRKDVVIPEDLYRYVLMSRATIRPPGYITFNEDGDGSTQHSLVYWRNWLAQKQEARRLGHKVSRAIRDRVVKMEIRVAELEGQYRRYDDLLDRLRELGYDTSQPVSAWAIKEKLERMSGGLPSCVRSDLHEIRRELSQALRRVERIQSESKVERPVSSQVRGAGSVECRK